MRFLASIFFGLLFSTSYANTVVLKGEPYELKPIAKKNCGAPGSSELAADRAVLTFAKQNAQSVAAAMCLVGKAEYCSKESQVRFSLEQLFLAVRTYPSRYRSPGCQELRKECVSLCSSGKLLSDEDCTTECNQYESWNK